MTTRAAAPFALLASVLCATGAAAQVDLSDEVFYHFMPIAWRDSDNDPQRFGDFGGMTDSLDYLQGLGITAVWMNPIFPSPAYHGYQHGPADQVNPRFGTEADFLAFVAQANARGIKVFIDFVVYGISQDSVWFQDAWANPGSQYDDWLAFENGSNTQYLGATFPTWNGDTVGFIHWNHNNPNPTALVTQWAQHWLDPNQDGNFADGIAGYRLDHVWVNYPSGPNGWGYNLADFWVPWKQALQSVNPSVITFAEQADWGITGASLLPTFDASMTKPFEFAARDAINFENATGLYDQAARQFVELPAAGGTYLAIIGDHDVDRLTSVIGGNMQRARLGAAILMTQAFAPIIYMGDEIGMLGFKGNYGSDANDIPMREPFKWNAVAGPPMSNYWTLNSQAFTNRYSQDNDGRSVEEQQGVTGSLLETYRSLIATRHANVALRRGTYHPVTNSELSVWAFVRHEASQALLVVINLDGVARSPVLDMSAFDLPTGTSTVRNIDTGAFLPDLTPANKGAYTVSLAGWDWAILEVDVDPPAPVASAVDGRDIPTDLGAGALLATQANPTTFGDNVAELNQLYARFEDGVLRVGVTGNLPFDGTGFALCLDSVPGGQQVLDISTANPPPAGPRELTGTTFDPGFEPDHMLFVNCWGGSIFVDAFALPSSGPAAKAYRGQGVVGNGQGILSGGTNPNGLQVAMDNSNTAGVTSGSAAGASTATTGFEILVPLDDIGIDPLAPTPVSLCAFILRTDGFVGTQVLPPLGAGAPDPGVQPDFSAESGDQFVSVAPIVACDGDADGNGSVDISDVSYVIFRLGTTGTPGTLEGDVDANGTVDVNDVTFVIFRLGAACP